LGDFIVKSSAGKKSRGKNKNRQSDSALLEQARSASPTLVAEKANKIIGKASPIQEKAGSVLEKASPIQDEAGSILEKTSPIQDEASLVRDKTSSIHEQGSPISGMATTLPEEAGLIAGIAARSSHEKQKKEDSSSNLCQEDEAAAVTSEASCPATIVRPQFEREDSVTQFVDPDPAKVSWVCRINRLARCC
jgi:hypothetical protein